MGSRAVLFSKRHGMCYDKHRLMIGIGSYYADVPFRYGQSSLS